jgi:hypothetical protein
MRTIKQSQSLSHGFLYATTDIHSWLCVLFINCGGGVGDGTSLSRREPAARWRSRLSASVTQSYPVSTSSFQQGAFALLDTHHGMLIFLALFQRLSRCLASATVAQLLLKCDTGAVHPVENRGCTECLVIFGVCCAASCSAASCFEDLAVRSGVTPVHLRGAHRSAQPASEACTKVHKALNSAVEYTYASASSPCAAVARGASHVDNTHWLSALHAPTIRNTTVSCHVSDKCSFAAAMLLCRVQVDRLGTSSHDSHNSCAADCFASSFTPEWCTRMEFAKTAVAATATTTGG